VKQDYFYVNNIDKIFIKNLNNYIGKHNLKFLEIGSHSGSSASGTLNTILTDPSSTITCVDHWMDKESEDYFDSIVEFYSPRIIKVKSDSVKWLQENQNLVFDFIYIDGDHSEEVVLADATNAWGLLKPDGIMAFDDYLLIDSNGNKETKVGVDKFLESIKEEYQITDNGYQLWITKNNFS
jgi:predicted O-methyltransferase YrrM